MPRTSKKPAAKLRQPRRKVASEADCRIPVTILLDDGTWGRLAYYAAKKGVTPEALAVHAIEDRINFFNIVSGIIERTKK